MFQGSKPNGWKNCNFPATVHSQPRKEPTAFDYVPDGSGRDLYVIRCDGLKRNFKSNHKEFENNLRSEIVTPIMDAKLRR